jgi:hypothetical protein
LIATACIVLTNGCLAPPIFFRKVEMYGQVLDQNGKPIPNVPLRCTWSPVRFTTYVNPMASMYLTPQHSEDFTSDANGRWRTAHRKVQGDMCVQIRKSDNTHLVKGLSIIPEKPWIVGYNPKHINSPTNPFTLWARVETNTTHASANQQRQGTLRAPAP